MSRVVTMLRRRGAHVVHLGGKAQAQMNTTVTNDLSADGITWANAPSIVDKNGNIIVSPQKNGGGTKSNGFTYRNASSGAWTDSVVAQGSLTRASVAYDQPNDLLWALWYSPDLPNPGILLRRYKISYTGNDISGIVSDSGVSIGGATTQTNLVMDNQAGLSYEHPQLILIGRRLVAVWACQSATGNELRASMCDLTADINAAKLAANWAGINTNDAPGVIGGGAPAVAFTKVFSSANPVLPYGGFNVKTSGTHAGDLYFVFCDGSSNGGTRSYNLRRAVAGGGKWTGGISTNVPVSLVARAGTDTGYTLKYQLTTKPRESVAGDCMYVGIATWKSNAAGDTWGFARIDNADGVTLVDVYSAGGAQSLYPTGDVGYDATRNLVVATYVAQTTGFSYAALYNGVIKQGADTLIFDGGASDVPVLLDPVTLAGKVPIVLRDSGSVPAGPYPPASYSPAPYHGWYATLDWQ